LGLSRTYVYRLPFPQCAAAQGDQLLRRADVEASAERRRLKKAKVRFRHYRPEQPNQ